MKTFEELLGDWTDFDIAQYYLACSLGMMKYDESFGEFRKNKGVFRTRNELADFFNETLENLVKLNVLERNDDGYRWNKSYRESREK
jgi:hypothetical protein